MPDPNLTPRFSIPQPIVNGDNGTWGGYLNTGMGIIDTNIPKTSFNEDLTSQINGSTQTFTLANAPVNSTTGKPACALFYNEGRLRYGSSYDYTISGLTITLITITPVSGDSLTSDYLF